MRQRQLIFLLVVVALAANAIGYLVFRSRRVAPASEPPSFAAERAVDGDREQRGRAQRQAGYQALLEGDYDKALIQLTEAKANLADKGSVEDLLRITDQLRAKAQARASSQAPAPPTATAEVAPSQPPEAEADQERESSVEARPAAKPKPARRAPPPRVTEATRAEPTRPEPSRATRPEPASPSPSPPAEIKGLLLVTSNPRGLLVHVDGVAADLTPMRSAVTTGLHRVALYDGDRKLFETLVDVTEGRPTTVVRDLSQELSPAPPVPTAPSSAPATAPVTPSAAATREPVPAATPPKSAAPEGRGGLEITSPGLYAEIWVNGRPYGFPPATVRELPAGDAEVEVRINGVVKRARTVTVEPGRVTAVKITK